MARVVLIIFGLILLVPAVHPDGVDLRWTMYSNADKILHAIAGFLLTVLGLMALPRVSATAIFFVISGIVAAVELVQLVGPRSGDLVDFLMGLLGISTVALTHQISKYRLQLEQST